MQRAKTIMLAITALCVATLAIPTAASAGSLDVKTPPLPVVEFSPTEADTQVSTKTAGTKLTTSLGEEEVGITLPGSAMNSVHDINTRFAPTVEPETHPVLTTKHEATTITSYVTDYGTQTILKIPSANSPHKYAFDINLPGNAELSLNDDGSVLIVGTNGPIGAFATPWAVDANGAPVETEFHVEGKTLVQTVKFSEQTAFPVIADPDFGSAWWGWFWRATKAETRSIAASGSVAAVTGTLSAFCRAVPYAPAAAACVAAAGLAAAAAQNAARQAVSKGKCLAFNLPWAAITGQVPPHASVVTCTR